MNIRNENEYLPKIQLYLLFSTILTLFHCFIIGEHN